MSMAVDTPLTLLAIRMSLGVIYSSLGRFAVLVFFLISGYFSSSETLNITKALRLVLEVLFYIALWSIVLTLTKEITWDYMTFRKLFTNYWFINVYLFVMVLSPFYVKLANILTRKQYIFLFLSITFLSEFLIHFLKNSYSELLYCSLGFLVGYYLKKYGLRINYKWRLGGASSPLSLPSGSVSYCSTPMASMTCITTPRC